MSVTLETSQFPIEGEPPLLNIPIFPSGWAVTLTPKIPTKLVTLEVFQDPIFWSNLIQL